MRSLADAIHPPRYPRKRCRFLFCQRVLSIYFLQQIGRRQSRHFEDTKRDAFRLMRFSKGAKDFLHGDVKSLFGVLAFNGIIEDGAHMITSELPDDLLALFNTYAAAEVIESSLLDDAFDGETRLEGKPDEAGCQE